MSERFLERYAPLLPWLNRAGAIVIVGFWVLAPTGGFDAVNFHSIDFSNPYAAGWHEPSSYVYSPAVAQLLYPFTLLPALVFEKLLLGMNLVALVWLLGPWWAAFALALLPVQSELLTGQIHLLLAVSLVLGMTRTAAWAPIILTKVTPGIGLVWFAVRREWRSLLIALGVTAAVVLVSLITWPSAWAEWLDLLRTSPDKPANFVLTDVALVWRLFAAAILAGLAAWRDRPEAMPFVVLLALPAVWFSALVLLAAIPRLMGSGSPVRPSAGDQAPPTGASVVEVHS
jgi:hypothetical protein